MIRWIANLMRQDWTNALRDNIVLYMMVGPLLLAKWGHTESASPPLATAAFWNNGKTRDLYYLKKHSDIIWFELSCLSLVLGEQRGAK